MTVIGDAVIALERLGLPLLLATLAIFLPGFAVLQFLPERVAVNVMPADRFALAPCAGILCVTMGWWLADPLGISINSASIEIAYGISVLLIAGGIIRHIRRGTTKLPWRITSKSLIVDHSKSETVDQSNAPGNRSSAFLDLAWLLIAFVAALILRLAVVRELALPAWVDGVHHTYIADLLISRGGLPADYGPLLEFGPFAYHFGFHAIVATVAIFGGFEPADVIIATGQLLSACAALSAYLVVRLYRGSPRQALAAGALASLVSYLPAYFVSWSRFTQLTGLIAVPAWLFVVRMAGRGPYAAIAAGVVSAALLLVHPRVAVMAAAWAIVDFAMFHRAWHKKWRWALMAGPVAVLVAAPWLIRLVGGLVPRLGVPVEGSDVANEITFAAVSAGNDPYLYALAAAGLVGGMLFGGRGAWVALGWLGLVAVAANPGRIGLPGTYLMSNGAVLISLWLPASCLAGAGVLALGQRVARALPGFRLSRLNPFVAPALIVGCLAASSAVQASLNPTTIIGTAADRRALMQMRSIVPPDTLVAVNARVWQLQTYMGTDGGYWIGVMSKGRSIVPPLLYGLGPIERARGISQELAGWEIASSDPDQIVPWMRARGIEWLYVGERGGPMDAAQLTADRGFELILEDGPARLWKLRAESQ